VAEPACELEPRAVASRLRQGLPAGRKDHLRRTHGPEWRRDLKAAGRRFNGNDAPAGDENRAAAFNLVQQGVEYITRPVAVGEKLAAGFFVDRDAELAEEPHRLIDGKAAEDAPDDGRPSAPEIAFGDDRVREVAAGAAADEDLRAGLLRAFEQDDGSPGTASPREDCGGETCRAGTDNGDIAV
jgi:hypothetical protein